MMRTQDRQFLFSFCPLVRHNDNRGRCFGHFYFLLTKNRFDEKKSFRQTETFSIKDIRSFEAETTQLTSCWAWESGTLVRTVTSPIFGCAFEYPYQWLIDIWLINNTILNLKNYTFIFRFSVTFTNDTNFTNHLQNIGLKIV